MSFQFGSGQNFSFLAGPVAFPSQREQGEAAILRLQLADLSAELAKAGHCATSARAAERIARSAVAFQQRQQQQQDDQHRRAMEVQYDRGVELENKVERLQALNEELRQKEAKAKADVNNIKEDLHHEQQAAAAKEKELTSLRESVFRLKHEVEHEKAEGKFVSDNLEKANKELASTQADRDATIKARDEASARESELRRQVNDLDARLDAAQTYTAELEGLYLQIQDLEKDNAGLETDVEELRAHVGDHERTIIVKDERISHLEMQYQRERQRNLNTEAAAARTAAASPIDEHPEQIFPTLSETLEDELRFFAVQSDDESSVFEAPLEYSPTTHTINISPIAPVTAPKSAIHMYKAASIAPVEAHRPALSTAIHQVANFEPSEARQPPLTFHLNPVASVAPIEPARPQLTISSTHSSASVAPIEAARPELTMAINQVANITPIDGVHPELSMTVNEVVNIEPVEARLPQLTLHMNEVANITPIDIARPQLTVSAVHSTTSVAPREAARPELTTTINQIANIAPINVTNPKYSMAISEVASIEPVDAYQPQLNVHMSEVASVAPTEAARTALTTTINKVVSVAPVEPAQPATTRDVLEAASVAPTEATRSVLSPRIQADANVDRTDPIHAALTMHVMEVASVEPTEPIQPSLMPNVPKAVDIHRSSEGILSSFNKSFHGRSSHLTSFISMILLPLVLAFLAVYNIYQYVELDAWRTANGVGFGTNNVYANRGAFGNGRYFLGIPLAMGVGQSWVEEVVARHVSTYIASMENWAGISRRVLF